MIIPVVHTPNQTSEVDPHKELRVALRLLSGQDCQRDASAAQIMLLNLGEGRHAKVAQDANQVLKAGAARDWFGEAVPRHFELERIAAESLKGGADKQKLFLALALLAGVLSLLVGVGVFLMAKDGGTEDVPWMVITLIVLAILGLGVAKLKQFAS